MLVINNEGGKGADQLSQLVEDLDPVWIIQAELHRPTGGEIPFTVFSGGEVLVGVNTEEDSITIAPYVLAIQRAISEAGLFVPKDDPEPPAGTDPQVQPG